MSRNYTKFNSTRSKSEFARDALAGVVVASNATAPIEVNVGGTTGWQDSASKHTLTAVGALLGDSANWAVTSGGGIQLDPGTYHFEINVGVTSDNAADASFHFALTDDSQAALWESNLAVPFVIQNVNETGVLSAFVELELSATTIVELHIGVEEAAPAAATADRGPNSRVLVRKIA